MSTFAFVILHYNTVDDTCACISSIRKNIKGAEYKIVIVDNGSSNGTGDLLAKKFCKDDDIILLQSKENVGFARGNNIGYEYAKKWLKVEFIVLLNSDTELLDNTFVSLVDSEYKQSNFAVLGPKVMWRDGYLGSNPQRNTVVKAKECIIFNIIILWYLFLNCVCLDKFWKAHFARSRHHEGLSHDIRQENVQLHGCFWVFSPIYVNMYDGLFPGTFLYREEEFLFFRLRQSNLKSVFLPDITILHKCGGATKNAIPQSRKRRRFKYFQMFKSTCLLYKLVKNDVPI